MLSYLHCPHIFLRRRVYVTVERPSVCPFDRQQLQQPAGLPLSALRAGNIKSTAAVGNRAAGAGAQQQMRVASH